MDYPEQNEDDVKYVEEEVEESTTNQNPTENPVTPSPAEGEYITRSGRISRPPEQLQYVTFESLLEEYDYKDEDKWCEMDLPCPSREAPLV